MIIEGHERSWKVMKGHVMESHGRAWMFMECHGRSFPDTRLTFQGRKVGGGGGWVMACRIFMSAPVPLIWTL